MLDAEYMWLPSGDLCNRCARINPGHVHGAVMHTKGCVMGRSCAYGMANLFPIMVVGTNGRVI